MDLHNRTTAVALVAMALIVVLAGFGCDADRVPPVGDLPAAGGITRWTSYTSPTLGITIPYPEGWVAEETNANSSNEITVSLFSTPSPTVATERPAEAWVTRSSDNITEVIAGLDVRSDTIVERFGITMRRIVFFEDFYAQPEIVLYLWEHGGYTQEVGGPNVEVVERMIPAVANR